MLWELFLESENLFFSISLCLMIFLGIVECLLLIFGSSSQGFLDQFAPDPIVNLEKPELELDSSQHFFLQFLDWLYIGRIPMLVWLIIFLTTFALTGFIIQAVYQLLSAHLLAIWIITPLTLVICMPLVRISAAIIAKILPKDETTAIYSEELIGRSATIILGDAKPQSPAQAKVIDQFGQTHYVMVEPELDIIFKQGETVILSQKTTIGFKAILSTLSI